MCCGVTQAPYNKMEYIITGDNKAPRFFSINRETGVIKLKSSLRAEIDGFYIVSVVIPACVLCQQVLVTAVCLTSLPLLMCHILNTVTSNGQCPAVGDVCQLNNMIKDK